MSRIRQSYRFCPGLSVIAAALPIAALFGFGCAGSTTTPTTDDVCVTTTSCASSDDCPATQHCNLALDPPVCQTLFCGGISTPCSEPAFCVHQVCEAGLCSCTPDCTGLECGEDPVCGDYCGFCDDGFRCESGICEKIPCVPNCTGLTCGLDPVCGTTCGSCEDGYGCQSGVCEKIVTETEMVTVPAGPFWMGCNSETDTNCQSFEQPYHEVTVSAFEIDRTEVTLAAYTECVDAGVCTIPQIDWKEGCNWGETGKENHPVNCVDWEQAAAYCAYVSKRLPTEAEWEKAARGTDGRLHPWGNEAASCDRAVMELDGQDGCGTGVTAAVCSKSPAGDSPYGACDMVGNVWEWVHDWYSSEYYATSPAENPTGPEDGIQSVNRVVRGGGFADYDFFMRLTHRNQYFPGYMGAQHDLGFRCARNVN